MSPNPVAVSFSATNLPLSFHYPGQYQEPVSTNGRLMNLAGFHINSLEFLFLHCTWVTHTQRGQYRCHKSRHVCAFAVEYGPCVGGFRVMLVRRRAVSREEDDDWAGEYSF